MTAIIVTTAFLASLLTLFSGFGLGTLLMPVVAIFFPVTVAVALTAFVHLLNNLFKLVALWRDVHWPVSLKFGIPALLATIPGAWLLTSLSELPEMTRYQIFGREAVITPVKLAVGVLLILFAVAEWFSFAKKVDIPTRYLPWGGILSGFFGGLSGHQGAFRSAFLLHAGLDAWQFHRHQCRDCFAGGCHPAGRLWPQSLLADGTGEHLSYGRRYGRRLCRCAGGQSRY